MKKGKLLNGVLGGMIIGSALVFPREMIRGAVDFYSDAVNGIRCVREVGSGLGCGDGLEGVVGIERAVSEVGVEEVYTREETIINYHANRIGVDPKLLMAIRKAENGGDGVEFGILSGGARYEKDKGYSDANGVFCEYDSEFEKQCCWAGHTIKKRKVEFDSLSSDKKSGYLDLIDYIGNTYCPVGAENDPAGLNKNWKKNVGRFYREFKGD